MDEQLHRFPFLSSSSSNSFKNINLNNYFKQDEIDYEFYFIFMAICLNQMNHRWIKLN